MKTKLLLLLFFIGLSSFAQTLPSNTIWNRVLTPTEVSVLHTPVPPYYTSIPDTNFEKKLIQLGIDSGVPDNQVLTANIESLTDLNLESSSISDLTGIQDFKSLERLNFSYNNVSSVDLSNNTKLIILYCSAIHPEGLTSLDVSNNILLEELYCSGNKITDLDLSKNTKLTTLICNRSEELVNINLKNGTNKNINAINLSLISQNIKCIQVDDVTYSNINWSDTKLATATFSTDCNSLGIDDPVFSKVVLYPNPTKGEINISNISLDKATVYNSLGQLVKSFTLNNANIDNTINLSSLPKGVYYIFLINGDAASAKKVIVE